MRRTCLCAVLLPISLSANATWNAPPRNQSASDMAINQDPTAPWAAYLGRGTTKSSLVCFFWPGKTVRKGILSQE